MISRRTIFAALAAALALGGAVVTADAARLQGFGAAPGLPRTMQMRPAPAFRPQAAPQLQVAPQMAPRPAPGYQPTNVGCGAAIAQVESQTGGTVISADLITGGGQARCRLVVLIPSSNRNRPPKPQVMIVPAG
ncbi:MAG: hypothetical protein KDK12_19270 [Rhodobacteraceae bacterium]|nr:hypothetical protein [Paracoccaceae bacterium]